MIDTILTRNGAGHAAGQEHDGRLTAVVVLDVAQKVWKEVDGRTVDPVLTARR